MYICTKLQINVWVKYSLILLFNLQCDSSTMHDFDDVLKIMHTSSYTGNNNKKTFAAGKNLLSITTYNETFNLL